MCNLRIQALTLCFLADMILLGKIELSEVPSEIRICDKILYIVAFRRARGISKQEYKKVLSILKSDIDEYSEYENKHMLMFYDDMNENMKFYMKE